MWYRFTFALKWVKHSSDKIDLTGLLSPGHRLPLTPLDCVASKQCKGASTCLLGVKGLFLVAGPRMAGRYQVDMLISFLVDLREGPLWAASVVGF